MARETIEGMMGPDQCMGAIGHMLVAERTRAHGVQHGAAMLAAGSAIVDSKRGAIAVTLSERFIRRLAERLEAEEHNFLAQQRLEISLDFFGVQAPDHRVCCHVES